MIGKGTADRETNYRRREEDLNLGSGDGGK